MIVERYINGREIKVSELDSVVIRKPKGKAPTKNKKKGERGVKM